MIFNQLPNKDNSQQGQGCSCQPSLGCGACFLYFTVHSFITDAVVGFRTSHGHLSSCAVGCCRDVHATFSVRLYVNTQTVVPIAQPESGRKLTQVQPLLRTHRAGRRPLRDRLVSCLLGYARSEAVRADGFCTAPQKLDTKLLGCFL